MPDDIEELLNHFRPAGPPADLRGRILGQEVPTDRSLTPPTAAAPRSWPTWVFRSAIAALLLMSITLIDAANRLNHESATSVGIGPPRWTPEAQQAADLLGNDPAARQYIALCLIAGNAPSPHPPTQGEFR
jgi:hypothetical protein